MLQQVDSQFQYNQVSYSAYQSVQFESFSSRTEGGENERQGFDYVSLRGESATSVTYNSTLTLDSPEAGKYAALQGLVASLLKEQGVDTKFSIGDTTSDIADLTPEEAGELIADDGYFGVEQTSERIFQFAVGIAGGDPARLDAIKQGVEQGFQEALEAFGNWLPDISYKTYDAVMKKLDDWATQARQA